MRSVLQGTNANCIGLRAHLATPFSAGGGRRVAGQARWAANVNTATIDYMFLYTLDMPSYITFSGFRYGP